MRSSAQAKPPATPAPSVAVAAAPPPSASLEERRRELPVLARGAGLRSSAADDVLAVASFNLLADCYVRVEGQPWNAFAHCDDAWLAWEARQPEIVRLLRSLEADVICLQEVVLELRGPGGVSWALPAWLGELEGYVQVLQGLKPKEWEKNSERNLCAVGRKTPTGVAVLYRKELFEECVPSKHGSGSGTTVFLRRRAGSGEGPPFEVAVANVHLVGDPSKSDAHVTALDSVWRNFAGWPGPRVICGDFNGECEVGGEVARWIAEHGLEEAPTGTSWASPGHAMRLDHVVYSVDLKPLGATGDLSPDEVRLGLPCASCPSDHAPAAAVLAPRRG